MAIQEMPIGYDSFEMVRQNDCYYVDKTLLIKQLIKKKALVTLITRPRRFGKSLNMSMLDCFFDNTRKNTDDLFRGLKIENEPEYSERNKYPTIFITLKSVGRLTFEDTYGKLVAIIAQLYSKHSYLFESTDIAEPDRIAIDHILKKIPTDDELTNSLYLLSKIMYQHYGKKAIILIDEYDVPMAKGNANNYYDKITDIVRSMFDDGLKTNEYLQMAIVTGCLRISKESIFTGLNHLDVYSISDTMYDEYFGFNETEVDTLLAHTNLSHMKPTIKEWYDGYRFGDAEIYCPWDVLSYVSRLMENPNSKPQNFWANTSSNDIIKQFLNVDDIDVTDDFETLLRGETIQKPILEDIVYEELTKDESNFWTVLYLTGYLTSVPEETPIIQEKVETEEDNSQINVGNYMSLRIPNREILILFMNTVNQWFNDKMKFTDRSELINAIWNGDAGNIQSIVTDMLYDTISYFDSYEYYYHGFMAGLLVGVRGCRVVSNREFGKGRSDIDFIQKSKRRVVIIEVKRTNDESKLSALCDKGLKQIDDEKYAYSFEKQKMSIIKIGMAFCGKECMVKVKK